MSHPIRTIGYFTTWGMFYGLIMGILVGATGWIMGMLLGAIFGVMSGTVIGLILGLVTVLIHRLAFHIDIDIVLYRRRLAVFNGLLVGITGVCVLMALITNVFQRPPRDIELADFYPLIVTFLLKAVILTVLCIAYISSHYPDWIIRTFYSPDPPLKLYSVLNTFTYLLKSFFNPHGFAFAAGIAMCFCIGEALQSYEGPLSLSYISVLFILALLWGLGVIPFMTFYICLGNAVLLAFLKRLFADEDVWDVFTYHYKSVLTVSSFILTVLMTNWYWILSPVYTAAFSGFFSTPENSHPVGKIMPSILGLFMAFHVSKNLAVDIDEKAKRKEKPYDNAVA
jgi:hypothetical protein